MQRAQIARMRSKSARRRVKIARMRGKSVPDSLWNSPAMQLGREHRKQRSVKKGPALQLAKRASLKSSSTKRVSDEGIFGHAVLFNNAGRCAGVGWSSQCTCNWVRWNGGDIFCTCMFFVVIPRGVKTERYQDKMNIKNVSRSRRFLFTMGYVGVWPSYWVADWLHY